jgi:hypothetical protein
MSPCLHETFVYNKIIRKKVIQKINGVKIDEMVQIKWKGADADAGPCFF